MALRKSILYVISQLEIQSSRLARMFKSVEMANITK